MSSYSHSREEDRNRSHDGSQYSSYGDDNVASRWRVRENNPGRIDETPSRSHANDRDPTWEQDCNRNDMLSAENSDLRRDVYGAHQSILRLLNEKRESNERIRELQDNNSGLEDEVAHMRTKLSFATDTIINEIQGRVDTATPAGPMLRALRNQIAEQTNTIEKLETQKRKAIADLNQLQLRSKKRKSSKDVKTQNRTPASQSALSDGNPGPNPPAREFVSCSVEKVMCERLIIDEHLTLDVILQLQRTLRKRTKEGKNLYSFIHRGSVDCYYCFHEVCEKGPDASVEQPLGDAGCQLGSARCKFLVKVVVSASHRKLRIHNPALVTSA
ncbi:hypothetical protein FACUT_2638 [Fusarium acutatum]|uniref:Uncharacterized protein n=1 Tax=Fusarium acutatum TaxID=78861 RepID=A0A8H4NKI7_9HYPO|nr:hypothetical protein FACUT_2638 [Fusarium acutatum]